jgi:hypothetical protein
MRFAMTEDTARFWATITGLTTAAPLDWDGTRKALAEAGAG